MAANTLKDALRDCLINFDQRVLVTDLLYEYGMSYSVAEQTLAEYIAQQEEYGTKYEKRFMVHGKEMNSENEVYTVVEGEAKLSEWLAKLRDAESSLYSVEVAGGAKSMPPIFKPMLRSAVQLKNVTLRADAPKATNGNVNGTSNGTGSAEPVKVEPKSAEVKKPKGIEGFAKKTSEQSAGSSSQAAAKALSQTKKSPTEAKKSPTEGKKSPPDEKKSVQKPANKKGIGNFFAPTTAGTGGTKKEATGVIKPPTPKKLNEFFKKQESKPTKASKAQSVAKEEPNVSIQLFDDDEHESDAQSSDEEEKLSALKRDIITSDHEQSDEGDNQSGGSAKKTRQKRRRIEDSDDEDEAPQQKHEKTDEDSTTATIDEAEEEKPSPSESYFDEESGFVITVKSKKSHVSSSKPTTKISPPTAAKQKSSTATTGKKTATSTPAANAGKTKQANIMNFFGKK